MADFWYTGAKLKLGKADLDFDLVDLRAKLLMTNTTADTDQDATNIAGIGTLDEYDGSGYTEIDLANVVIAADNPNNRAEITADAGSFGAAVGAGTRNWQSLLYYVRVDGTAANDYPVAHKDLTPANGNGGSVGLTPNAEGLLQIT